MHEINQFSTFTNTQSENMSYDPWRPTWHGRLETTRDALLLFEGCFTGVLEYCRQRLPQGPKRESLIASGNVFVYGEESSAIKRWTDGISWSPSRILTNFLLYREMNSPLPPGEKRAMTKSQRSQRASISNSSSGMDDTRASSSPYSPVESAQRDAVPCNDTNRAFVGSLVDSYEFKDSGLLKKTISVTVEGVKYHLVSYYSLQDITSLRTPREDDQLKHLQIREPLLHQPLFKHQKLDDTGDEPPTPTENTANVYESSSGYDYSRPYYQPPYTSYTTSYTSYPSSHAGRVASNYYPYPYYQYHAPSPYQHDPAYTQTSSAPYSSVWHPYPRQHQYYYPQQGYPAAHYTAPPYHYESTYRAPTPNARKTASDAYSTYSSEHYEQNTNGQITNVRPKTSSHSLHDTLSTQHLGAAVRA